MERTDAEQEELDRLFAATFSEGNPASLRVLDYLEIITVRRVMAPTQTDAELRHMEGARSLFGLIRNSVERGRIGPRR